MAQRTYKVGFPFSNGKWYVSIRAGRKFVDWLKSKDVPQDLKRLTENGNEIHESVRCSSLQKARELVWALERL